MTLFRILSALDGRREGRGESQRSTWSERERESGKRESTHAINIAHNGRAILQRRLRSARDDGIRSDSALERQGEREEERRAGGPESERELPKVLLSFLPPSLACFVLPDCPLCYGPRSPRELQDPSDIITGVLRLSQSILHFFVGKTQITFGTC